MKIQHTFRHLDHSSALMDFVNMRLQDSARFLLKDGHGQASYSKQKGQFCVDLAINTTHKYFKSTAMHSNIYVAVEEAVLKLEKQFLKLRKKVQNHKKYDLSTEGQLDQLNDQFEFKPIFKKAA